MPRKLSAIAILAIGLIAAQPVWAICKDNNPDDCVFLLPADGEIGDFTNYKAARVDIWRTDDKGVDREPAGYAYIGKKTADLIGPGGVSLHVDGKGAIRKLDKMAGRPDIHQLVTDLSANFQNAPQHTNLMPQAVGDVYAEGAINDLMIETIFFDVNSRQYYLVDDFAFIKHKIGLYVTVKIPDIFADTNNDGIIGTGDRLYSLVDLDLYLEAIPTFSLGDSFDIVNGTISGLPGMVFSTTPFIFDPVSGFTTTGLFTSTPNQTFGTEGSAYAHAYHPLRAVPEPASWAMMIAGFGMVGGALRSRRRVIA